jgi:hypothetical protein
MAKFRIADEFQTRDGHWEPSGELFGIDKQHAERYAHEASQLGGATHIFVKAPAGTKVGFLNRYSNQVVQEELSDGGWINFFLGRGSNYDPDHNTGPWNVLVDGETVAQGIGMPHNWHISKFLVIERIGEQPAPPPSDPGTGPEPVPMPEPEPDENTHIWVTVNTGGETYAGFISKQGDV